MILPAQSIWRNLYERLIQRNIYKSEHNCSFQGRDWMREPPPPMMSAPMMMDRRKVMIAAVIALGLLFLMIGAILVDVSKMVVINETQEAAAARANLGTVWGPAGAHFGIFLLVLGSFAAAVYVEDLDVFVRLFLLIVAFVALLLFLANSPTIFG